MTNDDVELASLLGVAAVFIFTLGLFLVFLLLLYRLLRFVWFRLPTSIVSLQGSDLDKLLGVVIALALVPDVVRYAWFTVISLFDFLGVQIRRIAIDSFAGSPRCEEGLRCANEIAMFVSAVLGDTAVGLMRALRLGEFPVIQFVLALFIAVIATQAISIVRHGVVTRRISAWLGTADRLFPSSTRQRLVFALLVVAAFYLGLSALLAIPLFQDKTRPQNLTVESLDRAFEPNIVSAETFEASFPKQLPAISLGVSPVAAGEPAQNDVSRATEFRYGGIRLYTALRDNLQHDWSSLRQSALNDQSKLREQAKISFAAGLESGIGHKQMAEHYYELISWHQNAMQRTMDSLRSCWSRATAFTDTAAQAHGSQIWILRAAASEDRPVRENYADSDALRLETLRVQESYSQALRICRSDAATSHAVIPHRKSFAESLGLIGRWSGWLLETEQMPVVIIVGLVGFSLLGATVSRAVRVRQEEPNGTLTLEDLLIVVAGGTTAAIVVFLAAYGGLAVLGEGTGDPNPYVLFATCLVGAVYSEDVWNWARQRLQPTSGGRSRASKARKKPPTAGKRRARTRKRAG